MPPQTPPDIATQYADVCAQIAVLSENRSQIDVKINMVTSDQKVLDETYQQQCKTLATDRLQLRQDRESLSRQIENLQRVRDSLQVEQQVQDHVAAAAEARKDVENLKVELEQKNKEACELVDKLKAEYAARHAATKESSDTPTTPE